MTKVKAKGKEKGRSVYIRAGHNYITLKPGETAYLIGEGGQWPREFIETMENREKTAYEKGRQDGQNALVNKAINMRPRTMEETLQECLTMLRQHHAKDQNQVVAIILNEMEKDRVSRVKAIQEDIARAQELLGHAEAINQGFNNIRKGGFEALNFR